MDDWHISTPHEIPPWPEVNKVLSQDQEIIAFITEALGRQGAASLSSLVSLIKEYANLVVGFVPITGCEVQSLFHSSCIPFLLIWAGWHDDLLPECCIYPRRPRMPRLMISAPVVRLEQVWRTFAAEKEAEEQDIKTGNQKNENSGLPARTITYPPLTAPISLRRFLSLVWLHFTDTNSGEKCASSLPPLALLARMVKFHKSPGAPAGAPPGGFLFLRKTSPHLESISDRCSATQDDLILVTTKSKTKSKTKLTACCKNLSQELKPLFLASTFAEVLARIHQGVRVRVQASWETRLSQFQSESPEEYKVAIQILETKRKTAIANMDRLGIGVIPLLPVLPGATATKEGFDLGLESCYMSRLARELDPLAEPVQKEPESDQIEEEEEEQREETDQ